MPELTRPGDAAGVPLDPEPSPHPPLRVVHVITTLTTGGAERQLEMLLGRSRSSAEVVALYEGGPVADSITRAGHRVHVLGMSGWRKAFAWFRLAILLRRLAPDVVHVHLLAAQLWGIPAARLARVPVVVSTEHSLMDNSVEGRPHAVWLVQLYRVLEKLATHTIAVSETTATRLGQWGIPAGRITVVDNGIDFEALAFREADRQSVRDELAIRPDATVIGAVGRLDPVKRMDQILRASASRLRAGGQLLVIAGAGSLRPELEELAAGLGVDSQVRWLGARGDVPRILSAMDVLVSASRDETFGMAVVEALGNGLPVVYAQCPALEELEVMPGQAIGIRISGASEQTPEQEVAALSAALDEALSIDHRYPVPVELAQRYGADRAAARVDEVYGRLHSSCAHHREG